MYKLNKGFFLGFLFKPLGGLCQPRGLNKKASEKYTLFITYLYVPVCVNINMLHVAVSKGTVNNDVFGHVFTERTHEIYFSI